jgi:hypothetical protein
MKITFKINYRTSWGQNLFVVGSAEELGANTNAKALPMKYEEDGNWSLEVEVNSTKKFTYNYIILNDNKTYTITSYMPDFPTSSQLSSKYFYGPRKFLAIKPKKLIFADDGFMFYGNNDDTSGKNVDQLIEFDIANAMFDSYNLDQSSINFNKRATGPGSVAAGSFTWDN